MLLILFKAVVIIIALAYCVLLSYYRKWFLQVPYFVSNKNHPPQTRFSIVVPARNEEENIKKCLQSIIKQNYPSHLFEVIVVDDHSTDNTSIVVKSFQSIHQNIHLLKLEDDLEGKKINAYKKKAIELAINKAQGDWIITTDADCLLQQDWLQLYDEFICSNEVVFVAAPVMFTTTTSILSLFQFIDFMALQATTAAAVAAGFHSMCNGANLAYNKNVFIEVGGFKGIDNIASGDDMLLMNKIKKIYPTKIGYLYHKNAIAITEPMPTWKAFFNQRIRWASKADSYKDKTLLPTLFLIYLFNLSIIIWFAASIFNPNLWLFTIALIAIKIFVEWRFLQVGFQFFGKVGLISFILLQPLHILYIVVAGWLGKFGSYSWKERKVK
jgi:cellulose synthase/poly-beta-1,6-N-acetylglucosamine synthase-like glycosyltransferase